MASYISMNSALTPKNIWPDVAGGAECPWVRIGNLYTSVTFTGSESWLPIVTDLHTKGQRQFTVLAGRHGDQFGQRIDPRTHKFEPRNPQVPGDSAINPADDARVALSLSRDRRYAGLDIQVEDVGNGRHNSVELLQTAIANSLTAGRVVILAWCYSLYAMKPGWFAPLARVWPQAFSGADMVPIYWTARDWSWVLRFPTSAASNLAGAVARQ